ncbi:MAG: hypothetical protein V3T24_02135 [Longimicrobiales bacterium]
MRQLEEIEAATLASADAWPAWSCPCGEKMRGARGNGLCESCTYDRDLAAVLNKTRTQIFHGSRVGDVHRAEPPAWDWPRDPRAEASKIHPADDWPALATELVADPHRIGPRSVVLTGKNDTGKSHRAADLIVRLHRAGLFGAYWVTEADLTEEIRGGFGVIRQHYAHAVEAPVLVLDDIFATRGGPARVEESIGLILDLVDRRYLARSKVTIYTTHRALSHAGSQVHGLSIRSIAPAVYGRLKEGLMLHLDGNGHRGDWAT